MYNYVFAYTASLVLEQRINEATGELWTDDERTAEAMRLYPDAFLHLAVGILDAPSLQTIGHPAFTRKDKEHPWRAPGAGYVKAGDLVFKILQGWVNDPQSLARFRYYINNRSTAACESFAAKAHKWVEKRFHYTRYYMLYIHCAVLDHDENVEREVIYEHWKRGSQLRHPGRWYKKKCRAVPTDAWREELWAAYLEELYPFGEAKVWPSFACEAPPAAEVATPAEAVAATAATAATTTGGLVTAAMVDEAAHAAQKTAAEAAATATAAALMRERVGPAAAAESQAALAALTPELIGDMKVEQLKSQLHLFSLSTEGKKQVLQERLLELLDAQAAPQTVGEDEMFEGGGEGGGDAGDTAALTLLDPLAACKAMGVAVEWFHLECSSCSTRLLARVPLPRTTVECGRCHETFVVANTRAVPRMPPRAKRKRGPGPERCAFMSRELKRLRSEDPTATSKVIFRVAQINTNLHFAALGGTEQGATRAPAPAQAQAQAQAHTPVTVQAGDVTALTAAPPPLAALPKAERPKISDRKRKQLGTPVPAAAQTTGARVPVRRRPLAPVQVTAEV